MTNIETTTDARGRTSRTYIDGDSIEFGTNAAIIMETGYGTFDVYLGWFERNGWNGSQEFFCARGGKPVKTLKGAERRVSKWFAEAAA